MDKIAFEQIQKSFYTYLAQERKASENTQRSYNADLNQLVRFWSAQEEQEQQPFILEEILDLFVQQLHESAIDSSSIARKMSCLNSLKKFLKKENIIIKRSFKRPHVTLKEPVALAVPEIFQLMDSSSHEELPTKHPLRDKAIIELLYATGIRCSELVQIEFNAIDFTHQSIVIRAKRKKERVVFFGSKAATRLKEYMQHERPEPLTTHERLFLNYRGTPLTVRSIQRICMMFRQCFESSELITPNVLRNSFATHLLNNDAEIETVQELLGHKTRASTERYRDKHST